MPFKRANISKFRPTLSQNISNLTINKANSKRIPLVGIFLSQFDMKKGNIILWSDKSNKHLNLNGLEFKSLPSGVHEVEEDVIPFTVPKIDKNYSERFYGVAFYKQNSKTLMNNKSPHLDRSKVKMFSLGIIVDTNENQYKGIDSLLNWKPNHYTTAHEYVSDLNLLLTNWMNKNNEKDFSSFEKYFKANCSNGNQIENNSIQNLISNTTSITSNIPLRPHMLEYLPYWLRKLGPLLLTLWKASLERKRILIVNCQGEPFEKCNSLAYCLSLLASYPPQAAKSAELSASQLFIDPLFTVGVSDIDYLLQHKKSGYVACTSDEILTTKNELFDYIVRLQPSGDLNNKFPEIYDNNDHQIKSTWRHIKIYQAILKEILYEEVSPTEKTRIKKITERKSWLQFMVDNFYWFGTAGTVKPYYDKHSDHPLLLSSQTPEPEMLNPIEFSQTLNTAITIADVFQDRVSLMYNKLKFIIDDKMEPNGISSALNIAISPNVLSDIDLDCFSAMDHEFVETMIELWFGKRARVKYVDFCGLMC